MPDKENGLSGALDMGSPFPMYILKGTKIQHSGQMSQIIQN